MDPSTASLFIQPTPPPDMVIALPLVSGLLNRKNTSPTDNAGPRLDTFNVPVPPLVSEPLTVMRSFEGETDLFTSMARLPLIVRSLFSVSVPMDAPGASVAPGNTVTGPEKIPVPASVPLLTVVEL